jgi:Patatin-like phospholipase
MNQTCTFWGLAPAIKWLFFRLPPVFSGSFALISIWWAFNGFIYADEYLAEPVKSIATSLFGLLPVSWADSFVFTHLVHVQNLDRFIFAGATLISFVVGFLAAYNISALLNWLVFRLLPKPLNRGDHFTPVLGEPASPLAPFSATTRIGIVLAGGAAKGAYQAGAMTAIYEFLDCHNALDNVKVIAGTSVGSWNAMFWLAGLIKSPKGWSAWLP